MLKKLIFHFVSRINRPYGTEYLLLLGFNQLDLVSSGASEPVLPVESAEKPHEAS